MRRTVARCRWCRVIPPADPDLGAALTAQLGTDELRKLLERFPDIDRRERRRLRQLYLDASATEVMAIMSSPELSPKARRLDTPTDQDWDRALALILLAVAAALALYLWWLAA